MPSVYWTKIHGCRKRSGDSPASEIRGKLKFRMHDIHGTESKTRNDIFRWENGFNRPRFQIRRTLDRSARFQYSRFFITLPKLVHR